MRGFENIIGAAVVAVGASACGIIPALVGSTTDAVLTPMSTMAQEVNYGLRTVDHTVSTMAGSVSTGSNQVAQTMRVANSTAQQVAVLPPATTRSPALTSSQKDAIARGKDAPQPDIPVLPPETIALLTVDQRGLQRAAQKAALTAPVGETIFWDQDGRSGTAMAKDEHVMGPTMCRTFVQSVTIDEKIHEGRAMACLDEDNRHWTPAF